MQKRSAAEYFPPKPNDETIIDPAFAQCKREALALLREQFALVYSRAEF